MTAFHLKLIAMITMTTDHIAIVFVENNMIMRSIGRIAFLLYAFMIAEGYYHIKDKPDRVKEHLIKLACLTVVSEFAYDYMETGHFVDWSTQSVMLVLLLGMIGLIITEKFKKQPWIIVITYAAFAAINYFGKLNFKLVGVLLIFAFYQYVKHARELSFLKKLLILCGIISVYYYLYTWARVDFESWSAWVEKFVAFWPWLVGHYVAMVILAAYNGKPGLRNKAFQVVYSVYYPVHMFALGLIRSCYFSAL